MTELDKSEVEMRVEDWIQRIYDLYSSIRSKVENKDSLTCKHTRNVRMYEELMDRYEVPPKNMPILDIYKNNKLVVIFKPVGLWVIGANGRIDVLAKDSSYILVDHAEKYETPIWTIYHYKDKKNGDHFTPELVLSLAGVQ